MKKRIWIALLIIIVVNVIAVLLKVDTIDKRQVRRDLYYDYLDDFRNENQIDILQDSICYEDDILGWFFYVKEDELYMNLTYMMKDASNKKVFTTSELPITLDARILDRDDIWSRITKVSKNQMHVEYLVNDSAVADLIISFKVEGSCGEYFANISVSDAVTGETYYTSKSN